MISDCWAKIASMVCTYLILGACSSSSPPITHPPGIDTTPPEEVHLTVTLLNSQGGTNQQASTSNTTSSSPECLSADSNDSIVIVAGGKDPQGLKDIQIWVSLRTCTDSGNTGQCSEGLSVEPIAHNPHQGDTGMVSTDRSTQYIIRLQDRTTAVSLRYTISARAINFAERATHTKYPIEVNWPPVAGCHAA